MENTKAVSAPAAPEGDARELLDRYFPITNNVDRRPTLSHRDARERAEKLLAAYASSEQREIDTLKDRSRKALAEANIPVAIDPFEQLIASYLALAEEVNAKYLRQSEGTEPRSHGSPEGCPTWHDGCHCTVESLEHNISRAEAAERTVAEHAQTIERLNQQIVQMRKDHAQELRDAATEERWANRQGEDYGSY